MLNPMLGYFKYSVMEMIYVLKRDTHFLYNEALNLTLKDFKWFFDRTLLERDEKKT